MTPLLEFQIATLDRATNDIQAAAGVAGFLNAAKLHWTKEIIDINEDTTLAELDAIEADYDGYAAQTLVWGPPTVADDNTVEVVSVAQIYTPTGATTPNQLYAAYIDNSGGTKVYFARQANEAPIPMNDALDTMTVVVRYRPASDTMLVVVS